MEDELPTTGRFGRAEVSLVGDAHFVRGHQADLTSQAAGLPPNVVATVVSTFAIGAVGIVRPSTDVRVTVLLEGDADLLIAVVRDDARSYPLRARKQGKKPGRARFSFAAGQRGTDVRVFEFQNASDADACFAWLNGSADVTALPDIWKQTVQVQLDGGERVRDYAQSPLLHEPGASGPTRTAIGRVVPWPSDMARQLPESMTPSVPTSRSASTSGGEHLKVESQTTAAPPHRTDAQAPLVLACAVAEMPASSAAGRPVDVIFKLSRDRLTATPGAAADEADFMIEPDARLIISISARGYHLVNGSRSRTIGVPPPGAKPLVRKFTLVGTDVGRGEVMIVVRQQGDIAPIASLRLISEIVEGDSPDGKVKEKVDAFPPDPELTKLPSISVDESICGNESHLILAVRIGDELVRCTTRIGDKVKFVVNTFARIAGLRKRLASERGTTDERRRMALKELRSLGVGLSQSLFTAPVRRFLWEHIDDFNFPVIQTTGEFDIPWELVYISNPNIPIDRQELNVEHFLGMRGVTRWVYNTALPTEVVVGRERARYLCPTYVDRELALTHTREEGTLVKRTFNAKVVRPGDASEMSRVIARGFDLLHFAGHGVWLASEPPDQRLLLTRYRRDGHGPAGSSYSASDLRRDLPDRRMDYHNAPGGMVFLNACDVGRLDSTGTGLGGFPEAFLRGGIGILVGCSWAVDDNTAGAFVRDFYAALGDLDVAHAADAARHKAYEEDDLSWLAYVVYGHPHATVKAHR